MPEKILTICDRIIRYSFYLLLFLVPLILTPVNYELFEYNKMMLTYSMAIIIVGAWVLKMISYRKFFVRRTPLDIPLLLFLLSQVLSYLFSLDRHLSFWGYYSRFHGGLASTFAYVFLYYAFVSNLDREKILTGLRLGLFSGALVALYGVAEHFGIDAQFWVQDVKNRVFSTLGQPNWLAAYLSILIPLAFAFGIQDLTSKGKTGREYEVLGIKYYVSRGKVFTYTLYLILASLYYLALLYTKSRSGFLGFWAGNLLFWGIMIFQFRRRFLKWFFIFNFSFLIFNFVVGAPFEQINRYGSLSGLQEKFTHVAPDPSSPPPPGGTESGEIRKIVWKGAIDVWRHYPIFGSGVETFAFSYYKFRPLEHNLVSEWDFLYNKAHNEYLNYLATTGIFGLGSYLLLIGWFLWWNIKQISNFKFLPRRPASTNRGEQAGLISKQIPNSKSQKKLVISHSSEISNSPLLIGLFAGYVSILVSNFFGFSVVVIALFFFLIPAFSFLLSGAADDERIWTFTWGKQTKTLEMSPFQSLLTGGVILLVGYFIITLGRFWFADIYFARGYNLNRIEEYRPAYSSLKQAIETNPSEPLYRDELSYTAALLAIDSLQENDATQASSLIQEAIAENQKALEISPQNVNFWKTKTRIFYLLSSLNEQYNQGALEAIKKAQELAPTDAKVSYNLAVLYGRVGDLPMALKTLKETVKLKPDYRDAHYALALYLKAEGKDKEAIRELEYILEKISSQDEQVRETLKQWGEKISN